MKHTDKTDSLTILAGSMSKAEKRYFRLYSKLQAGEKNYLFLFDLIEEGMDTSEIPARFHEKYPGASLDIAVKHLYKILLDTLLRLNEKQNVETRIFNHLSKAGILFERELKEEAFLELDRAKKLAHTFENDLALLLVRRTELKYLRTLNFEGLSEKQLVSKQMKISEMQKYSRNINQHLQLYDILKHRVMYRGHARSNKQKENLNDLVLSELNLVANTSYRGFEARKLHLLFQAAYYLNTSNYKSAIRYYEELIVLFENNKHLLQTPPVYYSSAIQGILESLHVAGLSREMPYFIGKLEELRQDAFPSEFVLETEALVCIYTLAVYIHTGEFRKAENALSAYDGSLYKKCTLLGLETQLRLFLYVSIVRFCAGDLYRARKEMKRIISSGKLFSSLPSFKTVRLFNLLLQAELENYDLFETEIGSIKRSLRYEKQVYRTEKLVFKFIRSYPLPISENGKKKRWNMFRSEIQSIRQDKYERRLTKTFDFLSWIESKLTGEPFEMVIRRQEYVR